MEEPGGRRKESPAQPSRAFTRIWFERMAIAPPRSPASPDDQLFQEASTFGGELIFWADTSLACFAERNLALPWSPTNAIGNHLANTRL